MPPIDKYYPPGSPERVRVTTTSGNDDLALRSRWYDQVRSYYDGDMKTFLDQKEDEPDDNVIINKVKQVVDRTVAFLFPAFPELELNPDISDKTPDEQWLEDLWNENGGIALAQDMAYVGSLSGDVYMRIMPADASQGDEFPQILLLDPKTVQTFWSASNLKRTLWHEVSWSITLNNVTKSYILDFINDGTSWRIWQYENSGATAITSNTVGGWELTERTSWPTTLPPIVHWKHLPNPRNFYGNAEFTRSQLGLNDKINLIGSENNRINRYHASPKTVATGTSAGEIEETAIDEMWAIEAPEAKVYNLEMQSDMQASINQFNMLSQEFLAESRVVILQGTVKDFQRVTNAGVRTVFIDMLSKNSILRWNYGKGMQMVSRTAAWLAKKGMDVKPTILFADPLPTDQTETANVAALERQMNIVSRQTLSVKRGYDWTEEKAKMAEEANLEFLKPPAPAGGGANTNPTGSNKPQSAPADGAGRLQKEPGSTSNA